MLEFQGKYGNAKVMIDNIDQTTISQIYDFLNHEIFTNQVVVMPDTHAGAGSVIGFTMEMNDKIIPNIVGVDINCGMLSANLGKNVLAELTRKTLDQRIREAVPFGTSVHRKSDVLKRFDIFSLASERHRSFTMEYNKRYSTAYSPFTFTYDWLSDKCSEIKIDISRVINSLGTLGGGNHFIELGKSTKTGDYWFTIHTGSRQFGLKIALYWQKKAGKGSLAYLTGDDMFGYLTDLMFATAYAQINRVMILELILEVCNLNKSDMRNVISTCHNYIDFRDFIIRKGAISSYLSEQMIIPLNMEDGILICEGKSNPDWNWSAPHGAGRLGSRSWAKKTLSLDAHKKAMEDKGIYFSKLPLDEVKGAYKDPKIIEEAIGPTATIIDRLVPILSMKE